MDVELDMGGKREDVFKDRSQVSILDNWVNGKTIYWWKHINYKSALKLKASTCSLNWQLKVARACVFWFCVCIKSLISNIIECLLPAKHYSKHLCISTHFSSLQPFEAGNNIIPFLKWGNWGIVILSTYNHSANKCRLWTWTLRQSPCS